MLDRPSAMLLLRDAQRTDRGALRALARELNSVNLPLDDRALADILRRSRLSFAGHNVRVQLARVIIELVDRHGYPDAGGYALGVSLSQAELGRLIGAGQDATAVAVRQLRQAGMVKTRYRGLLVSDLRALRSVAELE